MQRERKEQEWLVQWFKLKYKDEIIAASANGGRRDCKEAMNLKREGVLAGMPDIQIFAARHGYNGLLIEMKAPQSSTKAKGRLTTKQTEILKRLNEKNYLAQVAWGWLEAKDIIDYYFDEGGSQ